MSASRLVAVALSTLVLTTLVGSPTAGARSTDPWLAVAGDIACLPGKPQQPGTCLPQETAALWRRGGVIGGSGIKAALTLGDNQYTEGSLAAFEDSRRCGGGRTCGFDASWGAAARSYHPHLPIWASAGYHDWQNPEQGAPAACTMREPGVSTDACGLWQYGIDRANVVVDPNGTEGLYVERLRKGAPHPLDLVILDGGLCNVHPAACEASGSPEATFLQSRLASLPAPDCVVVSVSHAPFSAFDHGDLVGPSSRITYMTGIWQAMFASEVDAAHRPDLLLAGHDHEYQRFAPMDLTGATGTRGGVPEIVAGTGGGGINPTPASYPTQGNHQRRRDCPAGATCYPPEFVALRYGVLKLALDPRRGQLATKFYAVGGQRPLDPHQYACD